MKVFLSPIIKELSIVERISDEGVSDFLCKLLFCI